MRESFAGIKSTNPLLDSPNSNTMGSRLPLREENGGIRNERFHSSSTLKADEKRPIHQMQHYLMQEFLVPQNK